MASQNQTPIISDTVEPRITVKSSYVIKEGDAAKVKGAVLKEWLGVVRAEERSHLLRGLVRDGLGTKDVENFIHKQRLQKAKEDKARGFGKDRELVGKLMQSKLDDSEADEKSRRKNRIAARNRLEHLLRKKRSVWKRFINMVRQKATRLRKKLKKDNQRKIRLIRMSWKEVKRFELPEILARYKDAKLFNEVEAEEFRPGQVKGPVIVGEDTSLLKADEVAVLTRGPKFTVRRVLDKERFMLEMEKVFVKLRWALKDRDIEKEVDYETNMTKEEQERINEISEVEEAKSRMIFDAEGNKIDFRKSRATDVKHNSRIVLPGPLPINLEGELEMRRVAWGAAFDRHVNSIKDEEGVTEDNLTLQEAKGLKSLQKRVKNGELVVAQTDKSSRFAVMTLDEYEAAGMKHTANDEEVDRHFVLKNETQINGHMSMLLKTFMVGKEWGHEDRTRATKIQHSLSVAPMYILYKDHKGWTVDMGTVPPSRPVASAGSGLNDNYSETVSQALEPVANSWKGGMEKNSTGDMVDSIESLNKVNEGKELEEIDLVEIDKEMDRLELERETQESETWNSPEPGTGPDKIYEKTAKQNLQAPKIFSGIKFGLSELEQTFLLKLGQLKHRWLGKNNEAISLISKWEGWNKEAWQVRNFLVSWLCDRDDGQIVEDTVMMADKVELLTNMQEMSEETKEYTLTEVTELLIMMVESRDSGNIEQCQAQHECENLSFEISEDGNLCEVETEIEGDDDNLDVGEQEDEENEDEEETPRTHQQKLQALRECRKNKMIWRKKAQFQPVRGEVVVEPRRAKTKRGQRMLDSMEVDRKLVQDKSKRMVMVGADVEALYPSLSDVEVAEIVYQAIIETDVGFDGVDYMEGCKYIAMNSTAQECRTSPLRRVLPRRRHTQGGRPGVTGADPLGPESGDQEQWKFRKGIRLTDIEKRMVVATVMKIAVLVLFRTHVYEFGGKFYLQKKGGPIGLRSTCAIARIVMLWWDEMFMSLVASSNLSVEEKARYMDDIRLWMYSIRLGWRWAEGGLKYRKAWREEERAKGMTGLQKTVEVIEGMMNSICTWLKFTMETVDDFDGRLPTLDLNIWIREDNLIVYIFYQKPMASSMVIQKRSAMPENMRVATLNQEVIRRMLNTSERLEMVDRLGVVDEYAEKLRNSGYDLEYTRKIMVGGLTGYERKLALSKNKASPKWKPLHQGAKFNAGGRRIKKMLAKKNWFRKRKASEDPEAAPKEESPAKRRREARSESPKTINASGTCQQESSINMLTDSMSNKVQRDPSRRHQPNKDLAKKTIKKAQEVETLAVMFVDQTKGGMLQKILQEAEDKVAEMVGYRIRMVESSGTQLCRMLPYTNPWKGQQCGRSNCYTCSQEGEEIQNCKQRNILYESACSECNPEKTSKGKVDKFKQYKEQQGVYVGESSRSIFERAAEHLKDAQDGKEDSHMVKHWKIDHPEMKELPKFKIKVVASFQDALSRQLSEAVRIDLRGSNVLNSKSEYSRCRVPRLTINREEWQTGSDKKEEERKEMDRRKEAEAAEETLLQGGAAWDISKKGGATKRKGTDKGRKSKKRKLEKLVGWGEDADEESIEAEEQIQNWLQGEDKNDRLEKSEKMKQMEVTFGKEILKKLETSKKEKATPKLSKKEKLKKAAEISQKLTKWLRPEKKVLEWFEDPDLPELEDVMIIEEREISRKLESKKMAEGVCRDMLDDIVSGLEAASITNNLVEEIVSESWERITLESTWKLIKEDQKLESMLISRMLEKAEKEAGIKEQELEESKLKARKESWLAKKIEIGERKRSRDSLNKGEVKNPFTKLQPPRLPEASARIGLVPPRESHQPATAVGIWGPEGNAGIGHVAEEVGPKKLKTGTCQQPSSPVGPTRRGEGGGGESGQEGGSEVEQTVKETREKEVDMTGEEKEHEYLDIILEKEGVSTNYDWNNEREEWETEAYTELENILEEEDRLVDVDILESKMRTYLSMTNLLSKRIVGATSSVEPYPHESEILGDMLDIRVNVMDKQDNKSKSDNKISETQDMLNISISLSKKYISDRKSVNKRMRWDDGLWWLPPRWRTSGRCRWPSTGSSRGRSPGWSREADPCLSDILINEHIKHKQLWKSLNLVDQKPGEGQGPGDRGDVRRGPHSGDGGVRDDRCVGVSSEDGQEEETDTLPEPARKIRRMVLKTYKLKTGDTPVTSEGEEQRGPLGGDDGVRGDHHEEVLGHGDDGQEARHGPEDGSESGIVSKSYESSEDKLIIPDMNGEREQGGAGVDGGGLDHHHGGHLQVHEEGVKQMTCKTVRIGRQGVPRHKRDGLLQSGIKNYCIKQRNYGGGGLKEPVLNLNINMKSENERQGLDQWKLGD